MKVERVKMELLLACSFNYTKVSRLKQPGNEANEMIAGESAGGCAASVGEWQGGIRYNASMESTRQEKISAKKKQPRRWRYWLAGCVLLPLLAPLVLWGLGRGLFISQRLSPADAIVALGGDVNTSRLEQAATLMRQGMADFLIITETNTLLNTGQMESYFLRQQAAALGVPPDRIFVTEASATSTWDEARAARKLMLRSGWNSLIVVTDPYHTRRVQLAFSRDFYRHDLQVLVTTTADHWWRPSRWFLSREGWLVTAREYIKLFGQLAGLEHLELQ